MSRDVATLDLFRIADVFVNSNSAPDGAEALALETAALRFAAARVRDSGEAGTTLMANYVESLIVNLRDSKEE